MKWTTRRVAATTPRMSRDTAIDLIRGTEQFKAYHKHLLGIELKSFVTDDS
ncbi:hypothetical protein [Bacillus sp. OK048]|uniref:hypothetical protein n=1 Tax=Bacillus sp. OK048 TaxID=1882761 RepID=UPI001C313E43|nr:hypothetical protein [Bacillus sp. OK048]